MKAFLIFVCISLMGFAAYGFVNYFTVKDPLPTHYPYLFGVMFLLGLFGLLRITVKPPTLNKQIGDIQSFSEFVQLMVDGLKAERFTVDMDIYYSKPHWYSSLKGCAATHAIYQMNGEKPAKGSTMLHVAYNSLRLGYISTCLSELEGLVSFRIDTPKIMNVLRPYAPLSNSNWRENLHLYQEYADRLRAAGL
jgi:hypothetical protein